MKNLVWIVDDDEGILEVTQIVLEEAGLTAIKINNKEVLDKELTKTLPNLILLDISISGMDGRELAGRLKRNKKTQHIPILLMSADAQIEIKAKEASVDGYIKKPFDIDELVKVVKGYLG